MNYPIIKLGKSSITLWAILLNILVLMGFLLISTKIRNWLLVSVSSRKGVNVGNWRTAITLSYYAVLVLGLVGILQTTGLDLSFFAVLTGAIGIGIGFGMQAIFSNFISGIVILLEKPLKLGDRIEVGDPSGNVSGNVKSISVRATTIVTNDNVSIIVPNSDFISKQVINWSHSGNNVRLSISVGVAYDSDPDQVKSLLLEVAANEPGVLKTPEPMVRLTEFGESGLNFSLLVWTHEYNDSKGALRSLLNFSVLKTFKKHNIKIPYPQRDIHIQNPTPVKEDDL
ncbi:MAG TPA: mechanosensitive ion channel domain-containing protein [Bacteriovoracaceae bacterium]|nr:mechanosensitive ion channel domain-containing protein [Bacteriovoracaceae bacterium]